MRLIDKARAFMRSAVYLETKDATVSSARSAPQQAPVFAREAAFFDCDWYLSAYPDVAGAGVPPFEHYTGRGWSEGRTPHPMINRAWLEDCHPDVVDREPVAWYLEHGRARGGALSPALDLEFYKTSNPDLAEVPDLVEHFFRHGWREGRPSVAGFNPNIPHVIEGRAFGDPGSALAAWVQVGLPTRGQRGTMPETVSPVWDHEDIYSFGFDRRWYAAKYPDVGQTGTDPLAHYLAHGWREGRPPHPMINPQWLCARYPEAAGLEPLSWALGDDAASAPLLCPVFDEQTYRINNPDLEGLSSPLQHFLAGGWREARISHPVFRPAHYCLDHPDVEAAGVAPAEHFVQSGVLEGRRLSPLFWPSWYRDQAQFDTDDQIDLLNHYLSQGFQMGLGANPLMDQAWYDARIPADERRQSCLSHHLSHTEAPPPHPMFDPEYYSRTAALDVESPDLYAHFLAVGDRAGCSSHRLFDPVYYVRGNPDYATGGFGPLLHYVTVGAREMRAPNPMFDPEHFAWNSSDHEAARRDGLTHYISHPEDARHPHPLFDSEAYAAQAAARLKGSEPLAHYLETASNLDAGLVNRHQTTIPRAVLSPTVGRHLNPMSRPNLVSILAPLYNSPVAPLKRMLESVRAQEHQAWELILVDDGSMATGGLELAKAYVERDPRIRLEVLPANVGISSATNHALSLATGEFVALMDHDDVLNRLAIAACVDQLVLSQADICYTDQTYIDAEGRFHSSFFKPDFSPTQLLGVMYVGHLLVVRTELARKVEAFDPKFDKVQDFEFMLRLTEQTSAVVHVCENLYQWRMIPGSIAADANAKGRIEPLQAQAVNAHLARLGMPIEAVPHDALPHRMVLTPKFTDAAARPTVEILVPKPRSPEVIAHLEAMLKQQALGALVTWIGEAPDHHDAIADGVLTSDLNVRLAQTDAEVLVLVDPDVVEFTKPQWLDHLLMHLVSGQVAMAAPHLVDKAGLVVRAGSVLTPKGLQPAMQSLLAIEDGHGGSLSCDRDVSVLNGKVVAFRVDAARRVGGFEPALSSPLYSLADMALRFGTLGLRSVAVAGVHALLAEGVPDNLGCDVDAILFGSLHRNALDAGDPYFNKNFAGAASFRTGA